MIKISEDELANLLSYWISWTFLPELLENISVKTLNRIVAEYADYEYDSDFSIEIWKDAWMYYFDNQGKLTDDIINAIDNL